MEALREAKELVEHRMVTRRKRKRVSFDDENAREVLAAWKGVDFEDFEAGSSPQFLKQRENFGTR